MNDVVKGERIDTEEKFWALVEEVATAYARNKDGKSIGPTRKLNWKCDEGKWLALCGGEPGPSNWYLWREVVRRITALERDTPWDPVWADEVPADKNFCHVSQLDNMQVQFYENDDKCRRDILTQTTPGRYLQKYHGAKMKESVIRDWTDKHRALYAPIEFEITQDPDIIELAYTKGPNSCMSKQAADYDLPEHPARIYAGPTAGLAIVRKDKSVKARAVVNMATKKWVRIYGDSVLLERELKKAGYTGQGSLDGARLARIDGITRDGSPAVITPYIDGGCTHFDLEEDALYFHAGGKYAATGGGYTVIEHLDACDHCKTRSRNRMLAYVGTHAQQICRTCWDDHYVDALHNIDGTVERVNLGSTVRIGNRRINVTLLRSNIAWRYSPSLHRLVHQRVDGTVSDAQTLDTLMSKRLQTLHDGWGMITGSQMRSEFPVYEDKGLDMELNAGGWSRLANMVVDAWFNKQDKQVAA